MTENEKNWSGRIRVNGYVAGETFQHATGEVLDWPGGIAEAARYCVRGHAAPVGPDDKALGVAGEFADRLWALSGLLKSRPMVLLKGKARARAEAEDAETAMASPADENAMAAHGKARRPGKPGRRQPVPADDDPDLSEDD